MQKTFMSIMSKILCKFCQTILFSISEDMPLPATPQAHTEGKDLQKDLHDHTTWPKRPIQIFSSKGVLMGHK